MRVDAACASAGRRPDDVKRSACLFVRIGKGSGERLIEREAPPISDQDLPAALATLVERADEVILVLDPISESSIRSLRTALPSG